MGSLATHAAIAGDVDGEAENAFRKGIERDPTYMNLKNFLAWSLLTWGRFEEAAAEWTKVLELTGGYPYFKAARALALHLAGKDAEAGRLIAEVRSHAAESYMNPEGLCITALAEDDVETALDALEMAADERSLILLWIRVTPITAKLLGEHPRFTAINRSIWPDDYPEDVATGA